jgi:hypothetical protein
MYSQIAGIGREVLSFLPGAPHMRFSEDIRVRIGSKSRLVVYWEVIFQACCVLSSGRALLIYSFSNSCCMVRQDMNRPVRPLVWPLPTCSMMRCLYTSNLNSVDRFRKPVEHSSVMLVSQFVGFGCYRVFGDGTQGICEVSWGRCCASVERVRNGELGNVCGCQRMWYAL